MLSSLWHRSLVALVTLACFVALTSCTSSTSPATRPRTAYEKVQAAIASGVPIDAVIAIARAGDDDTPMATASGDDDMPDALAKGDDDLPGVSSRIGGCNRQGPPSRKELGCAGNSCLIEWRDPCGSSYYELTDGQGENGHFLEPYGCRGCRP